MNVKAAFVEHRVSFNSLQRIRRATQLAQVAVGAPIVGTMLYFYSEVQEKQFKY